MRTRKRETEEGFQLVGSARVAPVVGEIPAGYRLEGKMAGNSPARRALAIDPLEAPRHRWSVHCRRDVVSLQIHREVAARLRAEPALIAKAAANLERWQARHGDGPLSACYLEWCRILQASTPEAVAELLTREGEREDRLRQNSPFAGVLRPDELWRIKKEACHAPS